MSAFKGTPGPWESVGGYVRTPLDTRGGGRMIADCCDSSRPWDEIYANAALAAAAPELLEALKLCAGVCAGETLSKSSLVIALQKARAAIAKATGEQS